MEKYSLESNPEAIEISRLAQEAKQKRENEGEKEGEPMKMDYVAANDFIDSWSEAKKENTERSGKYYEIPAEFPYLAHGTTFYSLESILVNGIKRNQTSAKEKTAPFVDESVVCASIPFKVKGKDEPVFPSSWVTGGPIIILKMKPGEKIYQENVTGDHHGECRINRDISRDEIYSIQLAEINNKKYKEISLWDKFFSFDLDPFEIKSVNLNKPYTLEGYNTNEHQRSMAQQYPESLHGISFATDFLQLYNLNADDAKKLTGFADRIEVIHKKFSEFLQEFHKSYFNEETINELTRKMAFPRDYEDFNSQAELFKYAEKKFEEWKRSNSALHTEALMICKEVKRIFAETFQKEFGLDPFAQKTFYKYLEIIAKKHGVQLSNFEFARSKWDDKFEIE